MTSATMTGNETQRPQRCAESDTPDLGCGSDADRRGLAWTQRHLASSWTDETTAPADERGRPTWANPDPNSRLLELRFEVMSTQAGIWLESSHPQAEPAIKHARYLLGMIERRLTRFRDDSELCRLNAQAGQGPVLVSPWLFGALAAALELARWSSGLIDPTVLPGLVSAGYGPGPTAGTIGYRGVHLYPESQHVKLEPGVGIDLGGVAKGWAADRLVKALSAYGPALVDLGGDIAARGQKGWPLGVEDPLRPGLDLAELELRGGGVATSSTLKRRWSNGHHLIDPRTGKPAKTDLVAATVRAASATQAEGAAKIALLLGENPARAFLERAGLAALLVKSDGTIRKVGTL